MPAETPVYDKFLLEPVRDIFARSIKAYGPKHKAVAWYDPERMQRRFQIFAGLLAYASGDEEITINDLGCGYAAMFEAFKDLDALRNGHYFGYDISTEMIASCRARITDPRAEFFVSHVAKQTADYSFVSGSYNMKMSAPEDQWLAYVEESLRHLWSKTRTALGFNMLDFNHPGTQKTLYFADPKHFYTFCKTNFSDNVRLIDRLAPKEFVIFVMR